MSQGTGHEPCERLFELLYGRDRFWGYSLALTGNIDDAEDLLQDSIVKALTALHSLRDQKAFDSWFARLMKNEFIDLRRREKLLSVASLDEPWDYFPHVSHGQDRVSDDADEPEQIVIRNLTRGMVWTAIHELSVEYAEVVVLHYLMDYTVPEIVEITGEMDGTVRSRVSRARSKLREVLLPMIEDDL